MADFSKGTCRLCKKDYARTGISKHLSNCINEKIVANNSTKAAQTWTHIAIMNPHTTTYWLHVLVNNKQTLADLDQFLRDTWVECCGHLSEFRSQPMDATIAQALPPKTKLNYTYDFGSSTNLQLQSVATHQAPADTFPALTLLARNHAPEIPCYQCGKPAVHICTECIWDEKGWLCAACAKGHECGEEMLLPAANSPRVGVCAYEGGVDD